MKCKLDENLGDLGRDVLTASGHDVCTIAMQDLSGSGDVAIYEICRAEGRVLITLDRGFGEILRFAPETTPGIVILDCRGRLSPASILARIKELVVALQSQPIDGQLWIVEPGRVRVRERREAR